MDVMDPPFVVPSGKTKRQERRRGKREAFRAWNIQETKLGQAKHIPTTRSWSISTRYLFLRRHTPDIELTGRKQQLELLLSELRLSPAPPPRAGVVFTIKEEVISIIARFRGVIGIGAIGRDLFLSKFPKCHVTPIGKIH